MTSALQNRLVGTIIVVALVVILVPEFLDGEKRKNQQEFVDVPPVTEVVQVQNAEPFDTSEVESQLSQAIEIVDETPVDAEQESRSQNSEDDTDSLNANNKVVQQKPERSKTQQVTSSVDQKQAKQNVGESDELNDIEIKDSGWVVQLGSFKHEKNVKVLLKTLTNAGYRAYSRPVMTSVGELTKVFVGPELTREKLELALPHLKEITGLKGKITAFEVSAG